MWHQWFNRNVMKLREYFLSAKKTKITTLRISSPSCQSSMHVHDSTTTHTWAFLRLQTSCSASRFYVRILAPVLAASQACIVVLSWTSDKDWHEGEEILKVVIFVFFAHTKYSCSFLKWRLNHWCHMDYFNDILTTFLGLECGSCFAVY